MPYKREVDRKMHYFGETDFENQKIRVNPRKGDLINTVIHEELHRRYPDKPEKWVQQKSKKRESELTISKAINLLKKYKRSRRNA